MGKFKNAALIALVVGLSSPSFGCRNIGQVDVDSTVPHGSVFGAMISTMIPSIGTYETPIQFRIIQYIMMSLFNSMSSYEPNALDYFARVNVSASRRFCTGDPEFAEHRHQTLAFVILFGCRNFLPDAVPSVEGLVSSWNLDPAICSTSGACDDADTPWGYAKLLADETLAYSLNDGWNHDGSLSRSSNKIPFQDWRSNPYVPQNSPWDLESVSNWQPLLEHNGKGYLTFQVRNYIFLSFS
eukprot:m.92122 g.92122  ORF g.92122 m.92122 type:complete len:241 (-) comp16513_c0_seq28:1189-1911(-)